MNKDLRKKKINTVVIGIIQGDSTAQVPARAAPSNKCYKPQCENIGGSQRIFHSFINSLLYLSSSNRCIVYEFLPKQLIYRCFEQLASNNMHTMCLCDTSGSDNKSGEQVALGAMTLLLWEENKLFSMLQMGMLLFCKTQVLYLFIFFDQIILFKCFRMSHQYWY